MTRFLIIGDLHGKMPDISIKDFDVIIAPGDFCSDKHIRDVFMEMYKNYVKNVNNYEDWWDLCGKKKAKQWTNESLAAGRSILKRLDSYGKPVLIIPGNWDWATKGQESWEFMNQDFWKELKKGLTNVYDIDGKIKTVEGVTFIGYGKVNGPELLRLRGYGGVTKKDLKRNELRVKKLLTKKDAQFKKVKGKTAILLSHNVPYGTTLDLIKNKGSPVNGKHYGSYVARKLIEKHKPLVCIGGHMHEHFGQDKIGKTTIINAGFGSKVNTLLEISNGKIVRLEFYKNGRKIRA